ncbi:MAG: ABC transporter permease, partial [Salibacteraceae bacterium]
RITWHKFTQNHLAMFGLVLILLAVVVAFLGSLIRPDGTRNANDILLSIKKQEPGFTITLLHIRKNKEVETTAFWHRLLNGGQEKSHETVPIWSHEFRGSSLIVEEFNGRNTDQPGNKRVFAIADVVHALERAPARTIPGREFPGDEHRKINFTLLDGQIMEASIGSLRKAIERKALEKRTYWFGTDQFGRDMLSRLMAGTVISLAVGLIAVAISLLIGITLGAIAGYFRGWVDDVVLWLINVVWSIPTLLLVIAITFVLGKGFWQIFVAVGLTMWVEVARMVRGQVLSLRQQEYVEAGKAMGFNSFRIIYRHLLPNLSGPVIVIAASNFAYAILMEAGLSFLGIGLQPPMTSWGRMIKEHYGFIMTDGAYLAISPGIAIMLLVLSFMLVGNGLRDALDSRSVGGHGLGRITSG